jgi:hypothetical protein
VRRIAPADTSTLRRVAPPDLFSDAPVLTAPPITAPLTADVSSITAAPLTLGGPVSLAPDYVNTVPADLATGRGLTYEWELFTADVLRRLATVESTGGGGGGGAGASYLHTQSTPAGTWTIAHNLATKPAITIVSPTGDQLFAEVDYPDDYTAVLIFGRPYAGAAYLLG